MTAAEVARGANRAESTFWYQFHSWEDYVEELLAHVPLYGPMTPDRGAGDGAALRDLLADSTRADFADLIRRSAAAKWRASNTPEAICEFRRQLFLMSRVEPALRSRLHERYGDDSTRTATELLAEALAAVDLVPRAPFTTPQVIQILAALYEGLQLRAVADPHAVSLDFFVDVITAVALSLLTAEGSPDRAEDQTAELLNAHRSVALDASLIEDAADAAASVDGERELSWSGLAAELGSDPVTVCRRFQRLSVAAALAFGRHFEMPPRPDPSPTRRARAAVTFLCHVVRCARADRCAALSLLEERLRPDRDAATLRILVPLGGYVAALLAEPTNRHHERIVDQTLSTALSDPHISPADVAQHALTTHPRWSELVASDRTPSIPLSA